MARKLLLLYWKFIRRELPHDNGPQQQCMLSRSFTLCTFDGLLSLSKSPLASTLSQPYAFIPSCVWINTAISLASAKRRALWYIVQALKHCVYFMEMKTYNITALNFEIILDCEARRGSVSEAVWHDYIRKVAVSFFLSREPCAFWGHSELRLPAWVARRCLSGVFTHLLSEIVKTGDDCVCNDRLFAKRVSTIVLESCLSSCPLWHVC